MSQDWYEANQRQLMAALGRVRAALARHAGGDAVGEVVSDPWPADVPGPALEAVGAAFRLSPFERDLLLLTAGPELDGSFGAACAAAHGDPSRPYPTFGLALAALPDAHWSAITPAAPLRHWKLVDLARGDSLVNARLCVDERIVHELVGCPEVDERLASLVEPVFAMEELVSSHQVVADQIVDVWSRPTGLALPVVQLCGTASAPRRAIAATACADLGLGLSGLPSELLPTATTELDTLLRLWEREAVLTSSALLVECDHLEQADHTRLALLRRVVADAGIPVIVAAPERLPLGERPMVTFDVGAPTAREQRLVWQASLGPLAGTLNGQVERLTSHFTVGTEKIGPIVAEAATASTDVGDALWDACRRQSRPVLEDLAQRLETSVGWDDLVLPEQQLATLQELAAQVRQRARVYEEWGFGGRGTRGLAITALFTGASGTGKTLAAEVLANELGLDAYRIDLATVVSKYIGETEKNLRRVFDAAEGSGAILLFDEADALFGKRTEVRDSHDRYANIEVSYLLQRMEAYRGLAILTTNLKNGLDRAFLRRLRFVVEFPFPDAALRAEIWRRVFPPQAPTEDLDFDALARLSVTGGTIRNIALRAGFLAAEARRAVTPDGIIQAAQLEYAKLEKSFVSSEFTASAP